MQLSLICLSSKDVCFSILDARKKIECFVLFYIVVRTNSYNVSDILRRTLAHLIESHKNQTASVGMTVNLIFAERQSQIERRWEYSQNRDGMTYLEFKLLRQRVKTVKMSVFNLCAEHVLAIFILSWDITVDNATDLWSGDRRDTFDGMGRILAILWVGWCRLDMCE